MSTLSAASGGYLTVDPSCQVLLSDPPAKGKLVLFQRHGQAAKNVDLRPVRLALVAKLHSIAAEGGPAMESRASAILEEWKVAANDERWFDDGLNPKGVAEATAAGRELGAWLRTLTAHNSGGAAPELMVTSPFRRAWQTQLIGLGTAGLGGAKMPGAACGGPAWVAHDALAETPHAEASCTRHPRDQIRRWQPCLDVSGIADKCVTLPTTNCDVAWRAILKQQQQQQQEEEELHGGGGSREGPAAEGEDEDNEAVQQVIQNAEAFARWVRSRSERTIWVATHQEPMRRQLEAFIGADAVAARGYAKPGNAEIIAIFLPAKAAGNGKEL